MAYMQIHLWRHSGFLGRWVRLDAMLDGKRVARIKNNETITLSLPELGGEIQVVMDGCSSPVFKIPPHSDGLHLECGNPDWVLFDVIGLKYLPYFSNRTFFLREAQGNE
jgi:hypothetical protein